MSVTGSTAVMLESAPQQPHILVVDDEPGVLMTVQAILQQEGYLVDAAGSGEAALEAIRERRYDLVLTDLKMPRVDGLAVLAEVRHTSPETVTVVMTGYGSIDSALNAMQLGAYEYLLKPTEIPQLKQAVKRSLERKRFSEGETLYRINRSLSASLDATAIAAQVGNAARDCLRIEHASLMLASRPQASLPGAEHLRVFLEDENLGPRLKAGEVITPAKAGSAAQHWVAENNLKSFVVVPGISNGRITCILFADNGSLPFEFDAAAQRFLQALTSQAALALENALLVSELKSNNEELVVANQKLKDLDALKSQFLNVATHELRTPLTLLLGYNSVLAESLETKLNPNERETLNESVAACKRLIRLVNSMLDLSQIQSGKMRMELASSDLRELVGSVATLFHHETKARNISISTTSPSRVPKIEIDAERMQQVLINLLGNAVKFTPDGGAINLQLRESQDHGFIEISVRDNGVGILEQDQGKIFDVFSQIHAHNLSRRQERSGLGLAIARRIVEAHGGSIAVTSHPGEGSTFTVKLPVRTINAAEHAVSA